MNLERSVGNLAKRFDRLDPVFAHNNNSSLDHWKGKPIIPVAEWIEIRNTPYALEYFPDDFNQDLTYVSEGELSEERNQEDVKKWDSDFLELMEYTKNPNYGRFKCLHYLLSPEGDDPIFIGINRLVAKGLNNGEQEQDSIVYPCQVANRFQCPYERGGNDKDQPFDINDLFGLFKMSFSVELSLAKARKGDSKIMIKNKEELVHALTDKEAFAKILEQGAEAHEVSEYIRTYLVENRDYILDHFKKIMDLVNLEELKFY